MCIHQLSDLNIGHDIRRSETDLSLASISLGNVTSITISFLIPSGFHLILPFTFFFDDTKYLPLSVNAM